MRLKPVRGGKQRGICFTSDRDADVEPGVYRLNCNGRTWLADVRRNSLVEPGKIFLDSRIYQILQIEVDPEIELHAELVTKNVSTLSELVAKVESTKGLDSAKVADAISRRVSDLKDDLDGLILRNGDGLLIDRLGIRFTINKLQPGSPARVHWDLLSTIRLEAPAQLRSCNILVTIEIGAASHIADALGSKRRVDVFIEAMEEFAVQFDQYGMGASFSGYVFSEEIFILRCGYYFNVS